MRIMSVAEFCGDHFHRVYLSPVFTEDRRLLAMESNTGLVLVHRGNTDCESVPGNEPPRSRLTAAGKRIPFPVSIAIWTTFSAIPCTQRLELYDVRQPFVFGCFDSRNEVRLSVETSTVRRMTDRSRQKKSRIPATV
jgi:hypothetical protein